MKVFELIKSVLDETWEEIPEPKNEAILTRIQQLQSSYGDLTKNDPPDYSDPITRFAYIYKYTTCHASLVADKIGAIKELRELFDREEDGWTNVACVGGGPGSDFLGVVKHMMLRRRKGGLKCYLLDKEPAWGDTWSDVDQRAAGLDFRVSTHFQKLDVAEKSSWMSQVRYLASDLFTLIYFVSEVHKKAPEMDEYLLSLFMRAKPGALFLFIDNNSSVFYDRFDALATQHLETIYSGSGRFVTDGTEQKTDLEPYVSRLSHLPKLQTYIACRVYQKPR